MSEESKLPKDIEGHLAEGYKRYVHTDGVVARNDGVGVVVHPSHLRTVVDVLEDDVAALRERAETAERELAEARAALAEERNRYYAIINSAPANAIGGWEQEPLCGAIIDAERGRLSWLQAEVARLRRVEEAAAELVAIIPRPVDGHARSTNLVLVADMLRDALKEGKSDG